MQSRIVLYGKHNRNEVSGLVPLENVNYFIFDQSKARMGTSLTALFMFPMSVIRLSRFSNSNRFPKRLFFRFYYLSHQLEYVIRFGTRHVYTFDQHGTLNDLGVLICLIQVAKKPILGSGYSKIKQLKFPTGTRGKQFISVVFAIRNNFMLNFLQQHQQHKAYKK